MWLKAMTYEKPIYLLHSITLNNTYQSFFNLSWIVCTWKVNIHGIHSPVNDISFLHHNYIMFKFLFTWIVNFMIMAFYTRAILSHMTYTEPWRKTNSALVSQREMSKTAASQPVFRCLNRIVLLLNTVEFWLGYRGQFYWPLSGSKLHYLLMFYRLQLG